MTTLIRSAEDLARRHSGEPRWTRVVVVVGVALGIAAVWLAGVL